MKKIILLIVSALMPLISWAAFNPATDLFIPQFDSNRDPDDIHSLAALGCMLAHPDYAGVNTFAVHGAYGTQNDANFIESPQLFTLVFGAENDKWVNASPQNPTWNGAVAKIAAKAQPILNAGGTVWVMEAGQSDITADWVAALIADNVAESIIKSNVIVVQHSDWNEEHTTADDLAYVKEKCTYCVINDGNGTNTARDPSASATPNFRSVTTSFQVDAMTSVNKKAKAYWLEADWVIVDEGYLPDHSSITKGGVDFSDAVEAHWIFGAPADCDTVVEFWAKFVTNLPATNDEPAYPTGHDYAKEETVSHTTWLEADGVVAVELEHGQLHPDWVIQPSTYLVDSTMANSMGDGWIEWNGAEKFAQTLDDALANGVSTFRFQIKMAGDYTFRWHTKQHNAGQAGDQGNDSYVKFETGTPLAMTGSHKKADGTTETQSFELTKFTKVWIQQKTEWSWGTTFEPLHGWFVTNPQIHYEAGTHEIKIAGRSKGHALDRFVLYHSSANAGDAQNAPESSLIQGAEYSYLATNDFTNISAGAVNYYKDNSNNALAINAGNVAARDQFAKAELTFPGDSGAYDVKITTLTEEDGECTYRLLINGVEKGSYQNPRVTAAGDSQPNVHIWSNVLIQKGDTLAIESNTNTNGLIPENGGTAWARGRWRQLDLSVNTTGNGLNVSAGTDQMIYYPPVAAVLTGSASDDGSVESVVWTQISGPNSASFSTSNTAETTASNLIEGAYVFRLTATDDEANESFDELTVIVETEPPKIARTFLWREDFERAALDATSNNNQTLAGTAVQTANNLSSKVVVAPAAFTMASGHAILLSTSGNKYSALRPTSVIDLSEYHFQSGDRYSLSFDLYIPTALAYPIGSANFRWKNGEQTQNGPTDASIAKRAAGVWHIEYRGTFPVKTDGTDFFPTTVQPFLGFSQEVDVATDFVYLDNLAFKIEREPVTRTAVWSETFDGCALGMASANNQALANSNIETANALSSVVVHAPAAFTLATGKVAVLSTAADQYAAVRPVAPFIDLSAYDLQAGDEYRLSFDVYIPRALSHKVGGVNFRWKDGVNSGNGATESTHETLSAGQHRLVYTGTFPVDIGGGEFFPTSVRPFIWFAQNNDVVSDYIYLDNLYLEIGPAAMAGTGLANFQADYGLTGMGDDDDGDGMANLVEYAFGGHPLQQGASRGTHAFKKGNRIEYVYPRRTDPNSGVRYRLSVSDSLTAPNWSESGVEVAVGPSECGFESVTNSIALDGNQKFIRLAIESE